VTTKGDDGAITSASMPFEFSSFFGDVVATDRTEEVSGSSMHGSGSIGTDVHT
jgi:hypothetical protein